MKSIGVLFLVSAVVAQGGSDSAALASLDKNGDGIIQRSELPVSIEQLPDQQWAQMKNLMDKNADGKITLLEYEQFSNQQALNLGSGNQGKQIEDGVKSRDLNRNGFLDRSELSEFN